MKFVVATYGRKHAGMLLAHLHSIRSSHPQAGVEVYHQDIPSDLLEAIMKAHPEVKWTATQFDFASDKILRISSKTLAWDYAMHQQPQGETVCLLDVDTLVRKDLQPFFSEPDCDVIFTYKSGGFVLNTGVLLCRINPRTLAFFEAWRKETIAILHDPERFRQANDPKLPYGAADQMALNQMIGYKEGETQYERRLADQLVKLRAEPCEVLNETRSCPLSETKHILHYKGGWQPILLDGHRFSHHRPKAVSWEMYLFYLDTFRASLRRLNGELKTDWQARDFHIQIPAYVEERNPVRQRISYFLFVLSDYMREAFERGCGRIRMLSQKLRHSPTIPSPASAAASTSASR